VRRVQAPPPAATRNSDVIFPRDEEDYIRLQATRRTEEFRENEDLVKLEDSYSYEQDDNVDADHFEEEEGDDPAILLPEPAVAIDAFADFLARVEGLKWKNDHELGVALWYITAHRATVENMRLIPTDRALQAALRVGMEPAYAAHTGEVSGERTLGETSSSADRSNFMDGKKAAPPSVVRKRKGNNGGDDDGTQSTAFVVTLNEEGLDIDMPKKYRRSTFYVNRSMGSHMGGQAGTYYAQQSRPFQARVVQQGAAAGQARTTTGQVRITTGQARAVSGQARTHHTGGTQGALSAGGARASAPAQSRTQAHPVAAAQHSRHLSAVLVSGFPSTLPNEEVEKIFSICGTIRSVHQQRGEKGEKVFKVVFNDASSVTAAREFHGHSYGNSKLAVSTM